MTSIARKTWPVAAAIVAILGLARLLQTVQRYNPAGESIARLRDGAAGDVVIRLSDAEIISRSAGRRQWSLSARRIDLKRQAGGDLDSLREAEFVVVRNGALYRDGRPSARFSAARATYDQLNNQFKVRGGIQVQTSKGDSLTSEEMEWSERDDFVRFPSGATAAFQGNRVTAPMLLYEPRKRIVQCPQGAQGQFHGKPLRATALFWDVGGERVELPGEVSGEQRNVSFTAERATLDLKTRTLSANKGTIRLRIQGDEVDEEAPR